MSGTGLGMTRCVALTGLEGALVDVEAHVSQGLPHFSIGGLPDAACGQAPERVKAASAAAGEAVGNHRIIVNLSPASIPKQGTIFDLGIAIAVLAARSRIPQELAREVVHLGELGLDGRIRPVQGVLPAVLAAARAGTRHVVVPEANAAEAMLVDGVSVHAFPDLAGLLADYRRAHRRGGHLTDAVGMTAGEPAPTNHVPDLADVAGQPEARAALELAAAGGHHLLLSGPPGGGKTMLAERLVTILPPLDREAALQVLAVRSLLGLVPADAGLDRTPPFVAPHHSASVPAIIGGGSGTMRPGAITQAHSGVLFLDEAAEFKPSALQALRQPLESGRIVLARARVNVSFPAAFQLVLAANPCPCGQGYGRGLACRCSALVRRNYQAKLSGPLIDRVDVQVQVPPVTRASMSATVGESSAVVAARVVTARAAAAARWVEHGWSLNSRVPGSVLRRAPWRLPSAVTRDLDGALDRGHLSLRGYDRVLRLGWTCADLSGREVPSRDDLILAHAMRSLEESAA
ncbi:MULTISPECIES: YifB family Mg chelatase-like AAA ATPase [unclassified Janibacter]|uniref:YifB family Mg chelatase-like AAA ATPase n=1 Tax=unclassified Janibacter TaxID=2649294 RepID=UPI003D01B5C5